MTEDILIEETQPRNILYFQAPTEDAFMSALDAFCDGEDIPRFPLEDEEGERRVPSAAFPDNLRVDFVVITNLVDTPAVIDIDGDIVTPAVTRGWHLNMKFTPTGGDNSMRDKAVLWFNNVPTPTAPSSTVSSTPGNVALLEPSSPKWVWA